MGPQRRYQKKTRRTKLEVKKLMDEGFKDKELESYVEPLVAMFSTFLGGSA